MQQVEIIVKGHLDTQWSEWFGQLNITHIDENRTRLCGGVPDQSALYGLFSKFRDLGLELLTVRILDQESEM